MTAYSRIARYGLLAAAVALAPISSKAEEFINILTGGNEHGFIHEIFRFYVNLVGKFWEIQNKVF